MKWSIRLENNSVVIDGEGGEESGATITVSAEGLICLYEIPQFGGEPRFSGHAINIVDAIKKAESWT